MIDDNADLVALREAATDLAGDGDSSAAAARTWSKLTQRGEPARPRRRLTWLAVPAVAAAVLAVVLVAASVLKPSGHSGVQPGAHGSSEPAFQEHTLPPGPTPYPTVTNTDLGTVVEQVPLSQAVSEMVAAAPNARQFTFGPGQLLYQRTDVTQRGVVDELETHVYEVWTDPATMRAVRMLRDGADLPSLTPARPTNLEYPTPAFLASLPTDPSQLYAMFAALGTDLDGEHDVSKDVQSALRSYGALLSPALRVAYYRVLGLVPAGEADQIQVNGHLYYGVRDMASSQNEVDLLCDPATGEVAGIRHGFNEIDLFHYAVVDSETARG